MHLFSHALILWRKLSYSVVSVPKAQLGKWHVRRSAAPLACSLGVMLKEARVLFDQQFPMPTNPVMLPPEFPAAGGAPAQLHMETSGTTQHGQAPSNPAKAPGAPCWMHPNAKDPHTNAECRQQHGRQARNAGGGKRSREGDGKPRHTKRGGGRGGGGGRKEERAQVQVLTKMMSTVESVCLSMNNMPPRGKARGRGAR